MQVAWRKIPAASAVTLLAGAMYLVGAVSIAAQAGRNASEGIYASAQADRGRMAFEANCTGCHGADLAGATGPELAGERFRTKWEQQTVNQLYREMKTRMPRSSPGTLTDDTYLDLVAFLLQSNAFPPGRDELKGDPSVLNGIFIRKKAPEAVELPTGALVQIVGCLAGSGGAWSLTSAINPVRTANADASKGTERASLETLPLGSRTIQLLNVFGSLDDSKGRRMEAKGFLVRESSGDRLNVVTLEPVGAACTAQ
jgi:mono/diheme cytochrome c family protein